MGWNLESPDLSLPVSLSGSWEEWSFQRIDHADLFLWDGVFGRKPGMYGGFWQKTNHLPWRIGLSPCARERFLEEKEKVIDVPLVSKNSVSWSLDYENGEPLWRSSREGFVFSFSHEVSASVEISCIFPFMRMVSRPADGVTAEQSGVVRCSFLRNRTISPHLFIGLWFS